MPAEGTANMSLFKADAMRRERATTVRVGFAWLEVGKTAALETQTVRMPGIRPSASTTLVVGLWPIRAVPMWWPP